MKLRHPHDIPEIDLPEPIRPLAEFWLMHATQGLSEDAKMIICAEVCAHCLEAYERFLLEGRNEDTAAKLAMFMLGNRYRANRSYRAIYVTLHESNALDKFRTWKSSRLCLSMLGSGVLAIGLYTGFFAPADTDDLIFPMFFAYTAFDAIRGLAACQLRSKDRALVFGQFGVSVLASLACVIVAYSVQPSIMFIVCAEMLALAAMGEAMRMWRLLRKLSGNSTRMTSR
jgi:hypothetical protein